MGGDVHSVHRDTVAVFGDLTLSAVGDSWEDTQRLVAGKSISNRARYIRTSALHHPRKVVHVSMMLCVKSFARRVVLVDLLLQLLVNLRVGKKEGKKACQRARDGVRARDHRQDAVADELLEGRPGALRILHVLMVLCIWGSARDRTERIEAILTR